ncbi:RNA polymerase II transcription elongation factor domain-containing protein [Sarocladium implicatum]|nr:RNA polymerase II transcription elongation factor domain-containing protein [Sarocladium implicatum]
MAGLVDPTVTGNYPIILGDGLLGKPSNDIFTGIRYNHKPEHSSSNAPEQARLKPAVAGKTTSYDLSYNDNGTYAFAGTRNIDSKQYVLHFDPKRKAFILDRIDSTFNMNITRTPTNTDPESLRQRHPHIKDEDLKPQSKPAAAPAPAPAPAPKPKSKAKPKATGNVFQQTKAPRKNEKKQVKKDVELALPKPQASPPPEQKKRKPRKDEDDEDEEEEEGPDPLEVDWGSPKDNNKTDFSPAFTAVAPRTFDDYMNQRESEAEEADDDSEEPLDDELNLPSPVNSRTARGQAERHPDSMDVDHKAQREDEDDDMDDLEKDLENAFEDLENSQNGSPDPGDESEISEED